MDYTVQGVAKSQTRLQDFNFPLGFPVGKESACDVGELGSIPGSRRSCGEGNGHPFQYSYLENHMDRGAWLATYSPWGLGEGNGHPFQYSCLENHMGRGAWLATHSPWGHKEWDTTE